MENHNRFPLPPFLADYEVKGSVVLSESGCFRKEKFYVQGTHPGLKRFGPIRFLTGLSGLPETEITLSRIVPQKTFTVFSEERISAMAA